MKFFFPLKIISPYFPFFLFISSSLSFFAFLHNFADFFVFFLLFFDPRQWTSRTFSHPLPPGTSCIMLISLCLRTTLNVFYLAWWTTHSDTFGFTLTPRLIVCTLLLIFLLEFFDFFCFFDSGTCNFLFCHFFSISVWFCSFLTAWLANGRSYSRPELVCPTRNTKDSGGEVIALNEHRVTRRLEQIWICCCSLFFLFLLGMQPKTSGCLTHLIPSWKGTRPVELQVLLLPLSVFFFYFLSSVLVCSPLHSFLLLSPPSSSFSLSSLLYRLWCLLVWLSWRFSCHSKRNLLSSRGIWPRMVLGISCTCFLSCPPFLLSLSDLIFCVPAFHLPFRSLSPSLAMYRCNQRTYFLWKNWRPYNLPQTGNYSNTAKRQKKKKKETNKAEENHSFERTLSAAQTTFNLSSFFFWFNFFAERCWKWLYWAILAFPLTPQVHMMKKIVSCSLNFFSYSAWFACRRCQAWLSEIFAHRPTAILGDEAQNACMAVRACGECVQFGCNSQCRWEPERERERDRQPATLGCTLPTIYYCTKKKAAFYFFSQHARMNNHWSKIMKRIWVRRATSSCSFWNNTIKHCLKIQRKVGNFGVAMVFSHGCQDNRRTRCFTFLRFLRCKTQLFGSRTSEFDQLSAQTFNFWTNIKHHVPQNEMQDMQQVYLGWVWTTHWICSCWCSSRPALYGMYNETRSCTHALWTRTHVFLCTFYTTRCSLHSTPFVWLLLFCSVHQTSATLKAVPYNKERKGQSRQKHILHPQRKSHFFGFFLYYFTFVLSFSL